MGVAAVAAVPVVMGMVGGIMQGSAQRGIAESNARLAEQNATLASQAAGEQARQARVAGAVAVGREKATFGGTGIDVNSGTSIDVMRDTQAQYELDAMKAEYNGRVQVAAYTREAAMSRYQGRLAQRFGIFGAAFTGVTGATNIYTATQRGALSTSTDVSATNPANVSSPTQAVMNPRLDTGVGSFITKPFGIR